MSADPWPDPSGKHLLPPRNNYVRSYNYAADVENLDGPMDATAACTRWAELVDAGCDAQILSEAQLRQLGWTPEEQA